MPDRVTAPEPRFYVAQRLRLHYADWGYEGAPPLILLHGGRDHCRSWDWVADRLRHDYHVIAPDLRGHGDSQWSSDGGYSPTAHIYDLAQLIHQQHLAPVTIVAHSFGGAIALRYAGVDPAAVAKLVVIEGWGFPMPVAAQASAPIEERLRHWIEGRRALSSRQPRRYATIEAAEARMQAENPRLRSDQVRHLTRHGVNRNEDGTYSWKFDNYGRTIFPTDLTPDEMRRLWSRITCPVLLVRGRESWATDPQADGLIERFQHARAVAFDDAGHWVHHDQLDGVLAEVRAFLAE